MTTQKHENQLEFVRAELTNIPPSEWQQVAVDAHVSLRTLYTARNATTFPTYQTVFKIYCALKNRARKSANKAADKKAVTAN